MSDKVALSIVVPVYNSSATIVELIMELTALKINGGHEIILVDDGSLDNTGAICEQQALCATRVPITFVRLSRNFGEHNAVMAGLGLANGDYIITMDDDMQNPPSEVTKLFCYAKNSGMDVVYTWYEKKQHGFFRNLGSAFANLTARLLLDVPRGVYLSSFRCMTAFVADQVCRYSGPFPYVDGLILQVTQNIGRVKVVHAHREIGQSNYTLRRLIGLWLNIFLNFTHAPLRISAFLGIVASLAGAILLSLDSSIFGVQDLGSGKLKATILFCSGVNVVILAIIGEYVGRSFQTMNCRPQYVARSIVRSEATK